MHFIPDHFIVQRIHSDYKLGKIADHAERSVITDTVGQRRLSVTIYTFICVNAASDRVEERNSVTVKLENLYLCYFHVKAS